MWRVALSVRLFWSEAFCRGLNLVLYGSLAQRFEGLRLLAGQAETET